MGSGSPLCLYWVDRIQGKVLLLFSGGDGTYPIFDGRLWKNKNFRIFGPDEALSNRFNYIFPTENRTWNYKTLKSDEFLSENGRVMDSYLSEHLCEGMLEGYLLTGRHGFIHSYEAFIRIVDSMASQHAKWLKVCNQIPWRTPIASLNFMLVSHVFQQDHKQVRESFCRPSR